MVGSRPRASAVDADGGGASARSAEGVDRNGSRCRTIAHSLVDADKNLTVLILSGSPIIGSFDFRARVDFVRIPGVIKLRNGEYTSLNLHIGTEDTLELRASIVEHTADIFDPDLFIVDKEPLGLRGEVYDTLDMLRRRGAPI